MSFEVKEFLKQLISLAGLSAYEAPARDFIAETWRPLVDEMNTGRLGSLQALSRGQAPEPRPRLLIATHMDAIGLMVSRLDGEFLHVTEMGGVDARILPGQAVIVHGRRDLPGVVAQPVPALLPPGSGDKPVPMEHLLVDVGLSAEELAAQVRAGDLISFAQPPLEMGDHFLAGHSLDNRASVAALTVCLDELRHSTHDWDVWAVATVQEEETLGGAFNTAFELHPDVAIAMDVTFAKGPGAADYRAFPLDGGPTLGWGPDMHPALHRRFKDLAERLDMPHAVELAPIYSGTDAMAMQIVAEGIPSMVVSIPLRYMHTPVELISLHDISRAGHLLAQFIRELPVSFTQTLRAEWQA
jgi:endoglucanase